MYMILFHQTQIHTESKGVGLVETRHTKCICSCLGGWGAIMFDPVASMSLKHSYALLVYMHIPDIPNRTNRTDGDKPYMIDNG